MKDVISFDENLDQRYGLIGTTSRAEFEIKTKAFAIGEILREARNEAKMTQEELATKAGLDMSKDYEQWLDDISTFNINTR